MTSQTGLSVLIVEDEALLAMELAEFVDEEGHRCVGRASSRDEAIALAARTKPDIAFVDVHLLDGPTGIEAGRRIAQETGAAVVFISANKKRLPPDFAGAVGALGKPYTETGVRDTLRFVSHWLNGRDVASPPPSLELPPAPVASAP